MAPHKEDLNPATPYPFPTSKEGVTKDIYLNDLKADELKLYCREFKLLVGGKKAELRLRLKQYSADRSLWDNIRPNNVLKHKGPRTQGGSDGAGSASTASKKSWLSRFEAKGGQAQQSSSQKQRHQLPHEHAEDPRPYEVRQSVVDTAIRYRAQHPEYQLPMAEPTMVSRPFDEAGGSSGFSGTPNSSSNESASLQRQMNDVKEILTKLVHGNSVAPDCCSHASGVAPFSPPIPPQSSTSHSHDAQLAMATSASINAGPSEAPTTSSLDPQHPLPSSVASGELGSRDRILSVTLVGVDGQKVDLTFSTAEIPDPPMSFRPTVNVDGLIKLWSDRGARWDREAALSASWMPRIQGYPIPILLWPELYRYGKKGQWEALKKKWNEMKFFMDAYEQDGAVTFWNKFQDSNGKRLSFPAICDHLRKERLERDEVDCRQAREKYGYGVAFDQAFATRDGILTKTQAIAKRYRELEAAAAARD